MNKTNTHNQLKIYIDGELQVPSITERVASSAGNIAVTALKALGSSVTRVVEECATNVQLDLYDASHGSHLRHEYFVHKRELAEVAMRKELGL